LSRFPWVFILDDDAFIEGNVCIEALRFFDQDPLAAAVAFRIEDVPTRSEFARSDPSKVCPGGGGMFRCSAFETIGPQREEFQFGAEEIDWAVRCYQAGYRIRYAERATVFHDPDHRHSDGAHFPDYKISHTFRNRLLFLFYNFRFRTIVIQGARVCFSFFMLCSHQRSFRPFRLGLTEAVKGAWRTRMERNVVSREVEEFYTRPNLIEEEYSVPYWRKAVSAVRRRFVWFGRKSA
jgi:GT2 family glycosyltransferase